LYTDKQRLQQLLDNPDWSPEDREWFASYLKDTGTEELQTLMAALYERDLAADQPLDASLSSLMRQRIAGRTGVDIVRLAAVIRLHRSPAYRLRWWAAAAVMILLAGGWWYYNSGKATAPAMAGAAMKPAKDAVPGGNRAFLTMSDGRVIALDSAADGEVASQGNTKVMKLDSGLLTYRSVGGPGSAGGMGGSGSNGDAALAYNTITTPRGGQYQVVLPDGTRVWLNAASSLQFPTAFTGKDRTVQLKGEAYFEVNRDISKPFFVKMNNDAAIEVLGTHFNVNAYADEPAARTTLLEGSIRIRKGTHVQLLKPGQQAIADSGSQSIRVSDDADLDAAVAWKNGMFIFNSLPLETIMRQIARWYDMDVSYRGNVKGISFNGQISRYSNASQMLDMLATTGEMHFTIENKKIIVSPDNIL
jgi:transmembrane sensor